MPEPIAQEPLSIDASFDKGLSDTGSPKQDDGGGSDEGADDEDEESEEEDDEEGDDDDSDSDEQDSEDEEGDEEDDAGDGKDPKNPVVDPDNGVYRGEYNKERFDGLMSQWQSDRRQLAQVRKDLETFKADGNPQQPQDKGQPPKQVADTDIEIPPELANADEETKAGYKIMMKGALAKMERFREDVIKSVLDKVNEPLRQKMEEDTKVLNEVEELGAEFGAAFKDNKKEVLEFAIKNNYPLGTLRQAFAAFSEIQRLRGSKKIAKQIKDERDSEDILPGQGKNRKKVQLNFDPTRDGNKSISELFDEGYGAT